MKFSSKSVQYAGNLNIHFLKLSPLPMLLFIWWTKNWDLTQFSGFGPIFGKNSKFWGEIPIFGSCNLAECYSQGLGERGCPRYVRATIYIFKYTSSSFLLGAKIFPRVRNLLQFPSEALVDSHIEDFSDNIYSNLVFPTYFSTPCRG